MAMVDLEGVYKVLSKGHVYYYAWRGRGAPRLRGEPGSEEFLDSLQEARAGRKTGAKGKMSGLCAMFRASDPWNGRGPKPISEKTKASWTTWLDRIQETFGTLSIGQFDRAAMRPRITKWRDGFAATPRAADMGVQVLSRLLSFAQAEGLLLNNICAGIEGIYQNDRSGRIWTDEDLARVPAHLSHTAMLAALTGLRKSVLKRASWSHLKPNSLEIRSNKGRNGRPGKVVIIPLYGELRAFIDSLPKVATTILVNTEGRPWGAGLDSSWQRGMERAEIEDLHFHDLRGTAATKFYKGGMTIREIAEIMGWSEDYVEELINTYVKKDELLLDRIRRMDEYAARTAAAKPHEKPAS